MHTKLNLPDFSDAFERALYGTYLSYLATQDFEYGLEKRSDQRGSLAEFLKSPSMGQIFVSRTKPGITRGDHYHHTKTEKFLVLQGTAVIRFRHIQPEVRGQKAEDRGQRAEGREQWSEVRSQKSEVGKGQRSEVRGQRSEIGEVLEYRVRGEDYRVLDIPPGYTHSIENVGEDELVTLFWASEMFDPDRPDTYFEKVEL
jgi:UDP-2-acetamido-2,6-beta-L-arabino-hexul-4-ose reductase